MKEYRITTGHFQFGGRTPVSGSIALRDRVDGSALQKAADMTAERLPFLASETVYHDGCAWLRENGRPLIVTEGDMPLPLGSPEANGHEIGFSYRGDRLIFTYNHMIMDGRGFGMVIGTLLHCYCLVRYGEDLRFKGLVLPGEPFTGEEFADPYAFAKMPVPAIKLFEAPRGFLPPAEDVVEGPGVTLYKLRIPTEALLRAIAPLSGSPSVFAVLMLSRAMDAVYPDRTDPIVIHTAVDVRGALGCRKTVQVSVVPAAFVYSDRVKRMTLDRQMTCFRGMLLRQTDPDYLGQLVYMEGQEYGRLVEREKRNEPQPAVQGDPPIMVTYVGSVGMGELDKYCGKLVMESAMPGGSINIGMIEENGAFSVDLMYRLKKPDLYEEFLRELDALGIPCECDPPVRMEPDQAGKVIKK